MQIIPLTISIHEFDLWVILEAENIERMRAYDPAEVILDKLPEPWNSMRVRNIQLCYATPLDMAEVTKRLQAGEIQHALKFLSRGFRFRPDAGDHDAPYESGLE